MNELMIFNNPEFGEIRTWHEADGTITFCAPDAARALGYKDTAKAITQHCKPDGWAFHPVIDGMGRKQETKFITKGNLCRLAAKSDLPGADKFERWIFDKVVPSVLEHGGYISGQEQMTAEELMAKALMVAQKTLAEREARLSTLTVENQIMKPKADYFDELVDRNLLTNFRETAKQLEVGPKAFVSFLLERKYVYRDKRGKLLPYQPHVDAGLFEVKECVNEKTQWAGTQTFVTPKGRETFRLLYLTTKSGGAA